MEITVKLNNLRRSPTKIRPTLYLVRGKNAKSALDILKFTNKGCAIEIYKLLKSGIAAAHEQEMNEDNLYVKEIKCDGAGMYKRHRYGSRGRVVRIKKRNSHISLTVSDQEIKSDEKIAPKGKDTNKESKLTKSDNKKDSTK